MGWKKVLSKEEVLGAMEATNSNKAASRYLNVSYNTYRKYAKMYKDSEGNSLYDRHINRGGKGTPRYISSSSGVDSHKLIKDIVEGKAGPGTFNKIRLKRKLITEGYLKDECFNCGFNEKRVLDYKSPLILHFKDGNKDNYLLDNLQLLCYNCYFLYYGVVFSDKDLEDLEIKPGFKNDLSEKEFQVTEYHVKRLKQLGLYDAEEDDSLYSIVPNHQK